MRTVGDEYKRRKLETMLGEHRWVQVTIDGRPDAVKLPAGWKRDPNVRLNLSRSIPDLDLGDEGVTVTLLFSGALHDCFWPWWAMFGLCAPNDTAVFGESVPFVVAVEQSLVAPRPETKRGLRLVKPEDVS